MARDAGVEDLVEARAFVPYVRIAEVLCSAHVLFWVSGRIQLYNDYLPVKVFDYLASSVSILALLPDGPARKFAYFVSVRYVAETSNVSEVCRTLIRLFDDFHRGTCIEPDVDAAPFSLEAVVVRLEELVSAP